MEPDRLDRLRGRPLPLRHTARTISALAANPGCARRALLDASGTDKVKVAARAGFPAPSGQSEFAIARGNAFEARVKEDGAAPLLALLREHLGLDVTEARYDDLSDTGGEGNERRYHRTRELLAGADDNGAGGTMIDHPLLRLEVGGRYAYLEPDLVAFQVRGQFHVVEIKSFPVIDGQAEPAKVAAAAIQSAVYVLALRDLLGDDELVHHETVLVCPENFSGRPVAVSLDVRRQLTVLRRQLSRIARITDLADLYPGDLTFDLDPDPGTGAPRRPPEELRAAVGAVDANYAPECLSTCEMSYLCREEARGTTGALGKPVREDFGGVEQVTEALELARGATPPPERAEAAQKLRRAAALRAEILGETMIPGETT
ncbi:MAG: hypothetical protein FWE35_23795 [Streptosporangiales bacterium]|nr:hypothetical protein [Streptosporangiales bacterium]